MSALGQKRKFLSIWAWGRFFTISLRDVAAGSAYVRFGCQKQTFQRCCYSSFVDGFYQREFGLLQWARYAIAAIELGLLPRINASSSFTRYRKGNSAVASPDFFLPLTWPQMTSKG